jgi:hypothetical protein
MNARTNLTDAIRSGWDNHSATVLRSGLSTNHSATVVRGGLSTNHSTTVVRGR